MSDQITVKTVDTKSTVNIMISGGFMKRLQNIYFEYIEKIGVDNTNKILPHLKVNTLNEITDLQLRADGINIETLIILLKEIENAFNKENLVGDTDMDVPTED